MEKYYRKMILICITVSFFAVLVSCRRKCKPGEHAFAESTVTEAKCGVEGLRRKVCARCGYTVDEVIPALEHNFAKTFSVLPKCEEKGKDTYTCLNCGNSYDVDIPEAGHTSDNPSCLHPVYCTTCWKQVYEQVDHDIDVCRCRRCGGKTISGHEYKDGQCKKCYDIEPKVLKTNGISIGVPSKPWKYQDFEVEIKAVNYAWYLGKDYYLTVTLEVTSEWKIEADKEYIELYLFRDDGYLLDMSISEVVPEMKKNEKKTIKCTIYMHNVLSKSENYYLKFHNHNGSDKYTDWIIEGHISPFKS